MEEFEGGRGVGGLGGDLGGGICGYRFSKIWGNCKDQQRSSFLSVMWTFYPIDCPDLRHIKRKIAHPLSKKLRLIQLPINKF